MAHVGHTHGSVADMIFSVGPRVHRALRYRNSLRLSRHPRGRPACGAHMHGKAPAAQWDVRPFQRPIISHTHVLWPFGGWLHERRNCRLPRWKSRIAQNRNVSTFRRVSGS